VLVGDGILPGDRVRTTAVGVVEGRRVRPVLAETVPSRAGLARVGTPQ